MEAKNVKMYEESIEGVTAVGNKAIIIGEQVAILEDGREVEQYIYLIPRHTGQFISLKANIFVR